MNIGIYNIYFESEGFGGGERYMLTAAVHLAKKHTVTIITDNAKLGFLAKERFGIATDALHTVPNFFKDQNILTKVFQTHRYDLLFFLTDGSIPTSFARHNIMQVQAPLPKLPLTFLKNIMLEKVLCYSEFVRNYLDPRVRSKCVVIYPPVDTEAFRVKPKEQIILTVGRFNFSKKQGALIEAFEELMKTKKAMGWKLVLAGGVMKSDEAYLASLKKQTKDLPIEFYENIPFTRIVDLYARASLYWHAAGFGETNPMNAEHFGISTAEAMASGCIPLVFAGGGQPEIVQHGKNGYLWSTPAELVEQTIALVRQKDTVSLREAATAHAKEFSTVRFTEALDRLLASL